MKMQITAAAAALLLAGCTAQASTQGDAATQELLDKVAIAELLNRYYAGFGTGNAAAFNEFYTEDAVFDVNGIVANGKEEIEGIYARSDGDADSVVNQGTFHMLLSNPVIDVDGDTATAQVYWTGIVNPDPKEPPQVAEHGREYDKLVKRDGRWLIAHRVVIADSALPDSYDATYSPRKDFSFDSPS